MLENFRLRVFRSVAAHLSFRKAGEQLYLTQPAVTLQIKALEEELGVSVFERSARGVRLTGAGEVLLDYATRMSQIAEQAESAMGPMAALLQSSARTPSRKARETFGWSTLRPRVPVAPTSRILMNVA